MSTGFATVASFSEVTHRHLREEFNDLCALCLSRVPGQAAHWFDKARAGGAQLRASLGVGLVEQNFNRRAPDNGIWCGYSFHVICYWC